MPFNEWLIIFMFVFFLAGVFSGFPIAYVLAGTGVVFTGVAYFCDTFLGTMTGLDFLSLGIVLNRIYKILDNWVLVALPMFIFMGIMLEKSDLARKLMHSMERVLGKIPGGLALSVLFIGVLLAASTGIIGASVVLLSLLSLPTMLKENYSPELSCGIVCGAGTLGILIPPSIMLIIMADQLTLPVGDLFMGAVFPGLLLATLYAVYILSLGFFKSKALPARKQREALTKEDLKELSLSILPPLSLIFLVLGSIFFGWATPTEASGLGALGATLLALFNRKLNKQVLKDVMKSTLDTNAFIFAIIIGATCFSLVLRELGGDEFISEILHSLSLGPTGTLLLILFIVFLLGFFLDWIEITLIILPLVAPVIKAMDFNVNGFQQVENPSLVWFSILVALALQTSFLTPPVGFALFYLKGVAPPEIDLKTIYRGVVPFIILQIVALLIVLFFPNLVTWLPAIAYK